MYVCVRLQAHVHDHAWRPEDEQPHHDEHHAGDLSRGPQNSGGVPDSFTELLTKSSCCVFFFSLIQDPGQLWGLPQHADG